MPPDQSQEDLPRPGHPDPQWWHKSSVYQIYPASFQDSNGDGIGDINGIILRLDYLQRLGIDLIWLSPIFASPMRDNGYDISDYCAIAPQFGTLDDFDRLVAEAKKRDIGILLDLVVNHTSDQHHWFIDALGSRNAKKRDFYVWRDPAPDGGAPNDLQSIFGGPAWTYDKASGQYYLHQFSAHQPDLNWENPDLRAAIYEMMNWWLDRNITGFRMDVIDLIGKDIDHGICANGPHLHDYLREMHQKSFGGKNVLTVGEAWSATPKTALLYSGRNRGELSMVFQFEHVTRFWDKTYGKWRPKPVDLVALKEVFNRWQNALADDGWNSLFWGNHDLPRAVSRYGNDTHYRVQSAKMLATVLHLMKGTPFIFQGEELGMTNASFKDISEFRDVETLNMYQIHTKAGLADADFIAGANANGRDNARTPMQWSNGPNAGFTTGAPWIKTNPNYNEINAAACLTDKNSIFWHYKKLIGLRKSCPVIVYGRYQSFLDDHPQCFAYMRELNGECLAVIANFCADQISVEIPAAMRMRGDNLITNYQPVSAFGATLELAPYEVQVIYCINAMA
ncbi:Glucan 1,6-alpha-glucosidase [hydrothermal vent metagenome]|uniref:Glucan 1,6-alpha-glucosidase n=1 Tax=hydrothermal vent metagenome TaxID=652676 RepID=A0A3B0U0Z6_9ZZZZ